MSKFFRRFLPRSLILVLLWAVASHASQVIGYIDDVAVGGLDNPLVIIGWTCQQGDTRSLDIHLYLGNTPEKGGEFWKSAMADSHSNGSVGDLCGTTAKSYRFRVPISRDEALAHAGKKIYVYGISTYGTGNALLNRSGKFKVPGHVRGRVVNTMFHVVNGNDRGNIFGWACQDDSRKPLRVDIYFGGPATGGGKYWKSAVADRYSPHVSDACKNSGRGMYGFAVDMDETDIMEYDGQPIFVYAWRRKDPMAPFLLYKSGDFTVGF